MTLGTRCAGWGAYHCSAVYLAPQGLPLGSGMGSSAASAAAAAWAVNGLFGAPVSKVRQRMTTCVSALRSAMKHTLYRCRSSPRLIQLHKETPTCLRTAPYFVASRTLMPCAEPSQLHVILCRTVQDKLIIAGLASEAAVSGYHADNVGPALLGGFVLIRWGSDGNV